VFEDLIPELQPYAQALIQAAGAIGYQPRVTSTRRSHSEQARLWRRWQQGGSPYPAAPPGTSAHEYGFAFDVVTAQMEDLADMGAYWQEIGGVWGGSRDPIHFEFPGFVPPPEQTIPEESLQSFAIDTGIGFVPVFGTVTTVAGILALFPGLSQSEALQMLASPTHYYNTVRRLLTAYGY
jgi:hypothetical protein